FLLYGMGQLQPANEDFEGYDQAYILTRRGSHKRSAWIVRAGPATLLALVHGQCGALGGITPSLDDFREHLTEYGLWASADELQRGSLLSDLEHLGLVVDSPDAAGG